MTDTYRAHGCEFLIWSFEHQAYWLTECGYTRNVILATRFSLERALQLCCQGNWDQRHRIETMDAIVPVPRDRG